MISDNPENPAVKPRRDESAEAFIEIVKASLNLVPMFLSTARNMRRAKAAERRQKQRAVPGLLPTTLHRASKG